MNPQWEPQLEALRLKLHQTVDAFIDNLVDDGREGGAISEGEMLEAADALRAIADDVESGAIA